MFPQTALKTEFIYVKRRIFTISPGLVVKFVRATIEKCLLNHFPVPHISNSRLSPRFRFPGEFFSIHN